MEYSVQFSCSIVSDSVTPWIAARQASLSITISWSSLRLTSIKSVMPSSHLILCHPLLLLPPISPSIRVFSNESTLHEVAKILEFQLQHHSLQRNPGLISFRMDWLDLLAVQETLKSLLQHHSSKASILRCLVIFTVQLSHTYMTTYSAVKKNTSESVLMEWMKLKLIVQSEVSQKEKHQYSILMHIYGI